MSMELTKDERFTVYCIMLAEIESPSYYRHNGEERSSTENRLCWMYKMIFGNDDMYYNKSEMFPELLQFTECEWWSMTWAEDKWPPRIEALKQCIQETADF